MEQNTWHEGRDFFDYTFLYNSDFRSIVIFKISKIVNVLGKKFKWNTKRSKWTEVYVLYTHAEEEGEQLT